MRHNTLNLGNLLRRSLYSALVALWITGLGWSLLQHYGQVKGEFGPQPHPAQPWLHRAHGGLAMVGLLLIGALIPIHIARGWRRNLTRSTGGIMVAVFAVLALTGYSLLYLDAEGFRRFSSWTHTLVGFVLPLLLVIHIWHGRRAQAAQDAAEEAEEKESP